MKKFTPVLLLLMAGVCGHGLSAQSVSIPEPSPIDTADLLVYDIPAVKVLGDRPRLMSNIPGSAAYINPLQLRQFVALSANEVLRTVAGIHVVEEEGAGLRSNVGIRGLDPDRSSRVLILEDGVPVTLNPFGEPQMYYSPAIDRMESVEVLKGSGQLLFGPQTIGGVINYITADPPAQREGRIQIKGGDKGYFTSLLSFGNTVDQVGFRVDYLRKQADNLGPTQFRIDDLTTKFRLAINERSTLGLKLGFYRENSNATYIGLTQSMYEQGNVDQARLAPDDLLKVQRLSASATHEYRFTPLIRLKTTAFAYTTSRDWRRQDFSSSATASNQTGVVWGDPSIPGGAIYMRRTNGHRDRQFEVAGLEPRLSAHYRLGGMSNKLDAGVRFLWERAYEQRINGSTPDAASGALIDDETRSGRALSAYLQNRFELSERLQLTAGLRTETYFYERDIVRLSQKDTSIVSDATISQLMPGVGVNYTLSERWTMFAGVHRGFSPPRVKDAIANSGEVYNLDPELSWNSELGMRAQLGENFSMEMTAFNLSFSNQIIPISESSGGSGSGLVNGGSSIHRGIEGGFNWRVALGEGHQLEWMTRLTYVDATYNEDRFIEVGETSVNIRDNRTPYAPEWLGSVAISYQSAFGLQARLTANYTSEQFTDELNTLAPSANGQTGLMDAWFSLDGSLRYTFPKKDKWSVFGSVKNITDERYIVSRRPQGIRVSIPRFVSAGVELSF